MARHGVFEAVEPPGVRTPSRQQSVALGHGGLVGRHLPSVEGFQRPREPVEEAPPSRGTLQEKTVHLRREPDRRDPGSDFGLAARRCPVDPENSPIERPLGRGPRADGMFSIRGREPSRDGPAPGTRWSA